MDLASPAVSGTSVYANGLKKGIVPQVGYLQARTLHFAHPVCPYMAQ